ncbi:MAG: GNAT family N-acetyltransferase, partial [Bacteroidota bacterium]
RRFFAYFFPAKKVGPAEGDLTLGQQKTKGIQEMSSGVPLPGKFTQLFSLDISGFQELLLQSEAEGFRFLRRLLQEWETEVNRFQLEGEGLFGWVVEQKLVATLGINQVIHAPQKARLRRMYLHPAYRRTGIGSQMVQEVALRYQSQYELLELFTDTSQGAAFYESLGFSPIFGVPSISHQLSLHA